GAAYRELAGRRELVLEAQVETLHAAVAPRQEAGEIGQQAAQREEQAGVVADLVVELEAAFEAVRRPVGGTRIGRGAGEPVQPLPQLRAETPTQAGARQCQQLAQATDAERGQGDRKSTRLN